jgi:hypothetical protein
MEKRMNKIEEYLQRNKKKHDDFFSNPKPGDLLVFASCWHAASADFNLGDWNSSIISEEPIVEFPIPMTEEFLKTKALDMARETVRINQLVAEFHASQLNDDYYAGVIFHPGAGYQAAMSTGAGITFGKGTDQFGASYMDGPLVTSLESFDSVFNHDNKWIEYGLEFWRGVESCDLMGLSVTPRYNRTPLDLAWDLRGEDIFMDLYDDPEGLDALLKKCAESVIAVDSIFRDEIPILRNGFGGAQGIALNKPTMILNGDPLDLMSDEMVERFNNPALEAVTDYAEGVILHHHSCGVARAKTVSMVKNLDVQEIYQDFSGPRTAQCIDDDMIEASLSTPMFIEFPLEDIQEPLEEWAERLKAGRFIVHLWTETVEEARRCIDILSKNK